MNKLGGGKMVIAPNEELEQRVEGQMVGDMVSAAVDHEPRCSCSPDREEYWGGKRANESWSTYVNRLNTRAYPYGLSYENGC